MRSNSQPGLAAPCQSGGDEHADGTGQVAATAFLTGELGEGITGSAWIGVGVKPAAAFGADAAPVVEEKRAAEQRSPPKSVDDYLDALLVQELPEPVTSFANTARASDAFVRARSGRHPRRSPRGSP